MKKFILFFLVLGAAPWLLAQTAAVQVIHNSADALAEEVDVYVNSDLAIDDFEFRTATGFISLPAEVQIELSVAPGNSTSVNDALLTVPVTLVADETYVVVADGIVSPTGYNPAPPLTLQVYPMTKAAASNATNTEILVHHGSTDAPTVDVVETGAGAGTVVDDISYTEFQGYLDLPTSDYVIAITDETGTVTVASYDLPLATLGLDGAAVTAVASGFLDPSNNSNGPEFGIWVATAVGGPLVQLPASTAQVQVIHNSPDALAEEVDVYVDGALALDDFAFRTATPFLDLSAGVEIELAVAPATSTSVNDALLTVPVTLEANETYVVVANGIVSPSGYNPAPPLTLNVFAQGRTEATSSSNTDILVHHGSTDAPTVDVVENGVGAGRIVNDISYTEFQGYLEIPTADGYVLQVRDETGTVGVAAYGAPLSTLGLDGAAISLLASGFLDPSQNSNGPAFGLYAALASGGPLVALPTATLGTEENALTNVAVFPNPTNNILTVEGVALNDYTLTVVDVQGRIIASNAYSVSNNSIDVSQLASGVYLLNIENGSNSAKTIRFVKQ
jgi:hypothetical protein